MEVAPAGKPAASNRADGDGVGVLTSSRFNVCLREAQRLPCASCVTCVLLYKPLQVTSHLLVVPTASCAPQIAQSQPGRRNPPPAPVKASRCALTAWHPEIDRARAGPIGCWGPVGSCGILWDPVVPTCVLSGGWSLTFATHAPRRKKDAVTEVCCRQCCSCAAGVDTHAHARARVGVMHSHATRLRPPPPVPPPLSLSPSLFLRTSTIHKTIHSQQHATVNLG